MYRYIILYFLSVTVVANVPESLVRKAEQVILVDAQTHHVLFAKNADIPTHPSSMTKLMTAYMVFSHLKSKKLSLTDTFRVSKKAWKKPGTRMFVEPGSHVSVENLLRGTIVSSGNDATTVLAEGLYGSEELFAQEMTRVAHELGATHTYFCNASGLEMAEHLTTARDLSLLAHALIRDFPEYYHYFKEVTFSYNKITQHNRNRLLRTSSLSVDGIKTGRTDAGGYGIVATAKDKGRRLIAVVNGTKSESERAQITESLLQWGFRTSYNTLLIKKDTPITHAPTWMGVQKSLALISPKDIWITLPRGTKATASFIYTKPVPAPIHKGDTIGKLIVHLPNKVSYIEPLVAQTEVTKVGFWKKLYSALCYYLWGGS